MAASAPSSRAMKFVWPAGRLDHFLLFYRAENPLSPILRNWFQILAETVGRFQSPAVDPGRFIRRITRLNSIAAAVLAVDQELNLIASRLPGTSDKGQAWAFREMGGHNSTLSH